MKQIVIYHRADFDGIFCREIARKFLPEAQLIGWDYGDPVPTPDVVSSEDQLYMLDISIDGLMGHPKLIWIDHHKSAIEKYGNNIDGYRIDGVAACRLTWQWFQHLIPGGVLWEKPLATKQEFIDRSVSEPWAVRLAGEYDIWDKRDLEAELFQHGLRSRDLKTERWGDYSIWEVLLSDDSMNRACVRDLLVSAKYIQYAKTAENESIIRAAGFTIEFEGLKFLACNHARYNSHLFTAGLKPEHDACFGFAWRDGQWTVSLYHAPGKEYHDLSLIAVKHGGGGHRGACGFRTAKLPFLN